MKTLFFPLTILLASLAATIAFAGATKYGTISGYLTKVDNNSFNIVNSQGLNIVIPSKYFPTHAPKKLGTFLVVTVDPADIKSQPTKSIFQTR